MTVLNGRNRSAHEIRTGLYGIVILGIQQAVMVGNYEAFFWWLLLPFFSPRIMGELTYLAGRVRGFFGK